MSAARRRIVETLEYPELDAAVVWSLVADPDRLAEWFPLRPVGDRRTVEPGVGTTFRVARWWRVPALGSRVVEVVGWRAGEAYRCRVDGMLGCVEFRVRVAPRPAGAGTSVTLEVRSAARTPLVGAVLRGAWRRRLRAALRRIPRVLGG